MQDFRRPGYTIEAGLGTNPLPLSQFDEIYRRNIGILVHGAAVTALPDFGQTFQLAKKVPPRLSAKQFF